MENKNSFTVIIHAARINLDISCNEYCVASFINWGAFNPKNSSGWCHASKLHIAEILGISKTNILKIIDRLIEKDILARDPETKFLRTTEKWFNSTSDNHILPVTKDYRRIRKITGTGNERLPESGNERLPYNISNNISNINTPVAPVIVSEDEKKFLLFSEWIKKWAPNVAKMKEPFTLEQYLKIKAKGYTPEEVQDLLRTMHNWKPLLAKNVSAYLTFENWKRK